MSYILDALKKSEQDQARRRTPDIHSAHDTPVARRAPRRDKLGKMSLPLVAANVVLAGALVTMWLFSPSFERTVPRDTPALAFATEPAAETPAPVRTAPAFSPASPRPQSLTFSTHIYASDPSFRTVTINGTRLTEGDRIDESLLLLEITREGVVFERNGERVEVAVLNDWNR